MPAHKEISPVANPWLTNNTRNTLNTIAPGVIEFHRTLAVAWCAYSTVIELRRDFPDEIGGICWYAVDNPAQSPHIPIFSGTTSLPEAFNRCGHKQYDADCVLWQFRRANKLATLSWQTTKKDFNASVLKMEDFAFDTLARTEEAYKKAKSAKAKSGILNGCTATVHSEAVKEWKDMEAKYWSMFGRGF